VSLAHYETARRSTTSAPTPEATSVRVATKVTGPTSGVPPVVGSAVAVAVGLAVAVAVGVAVAVAMGLAVMGSPPYCWAKAAEASSRTSTALTATTSKMWALHTTGVNRCFSSSLISPNRVVGVSRLWRWGTMRTVVCRTSSDKNHGDHRAKVHHPSP
jgi:hypothetical protein